MSTYLEDSMTLVNEFLRKSRKKLKWPQIINEMVLYFKLF